jgi:hypothetical protein
MENHENNGHGESHDDHATEGNRQYYPKGWWMPLVGLLVVALGFTAIGTFAFSVSGTDRWGKKEQCEMKDGKEGECCKDGKEGECKDEHGKGDSKEMKEGKEGKSNNPATDVKPYYQSDSAKATPAQLEKVEEHK